MMQSVLIWTGAVPLSGCWVHRDGSPGAGRLCAPSITAAQAQLTQPAAEINKPIQAGKLGFWTWGCWAFTTLRSGILPVPSHWALWIPAKIMDGHCLNSEGFEQSLWLSCICHTRSDPQHLAGLSPSLILLNPSLLTLKATRQGFLSTFPEQAACLSWAFWH